VTNSGILKSEICVFLHVSIPRNTP
jgi:hypothetical protein